MRAPVARGDDLFDETFMSRLSWLEIVAKRAIQGRDRGERRLRRLGAGLEFADHRRYSPGDDFRHIDWNVYQRLGKLLLRLYEEDEDLTVYVLVDTSASMGLAGGARFDQARRIAASLAYIALANLDRASVVAIGEEAGPRFVPARGKAQLFPILDFLRGLEPGGCTRLGDSVRSFVKKAPRRGLVLVISDLYAEDGYTDGLSLLRYHHFEPLMLHLTDAGELPGAGRGEVSLVDCETGVTREITLTPKVLARYEEARLRWRDDVESFCLSQQIPYLEVLAGRPMEDVVVDLLRHGGFLR